MLAGLCFVRVELFAGPACLSGKWCAVLLPLLHLATENNGPLKITAPWSLSRPGAFSFYCFTLVELGEQPFFMAHRTCEG